MFRILFLIWLFLLHPVHETLTSIEYVKESNEFKGFMRINMDDYISDCNLHGYAVSKEELLARKATARGNLEKYINDKLVVNVNKSDIPGRIDEIYLTGNELDIMLSYVVSSEPVTVSVKNSIMADLYEDQSNMMIMKVGEFEEGVKFTSFITDKTFIIK